MQFFNRHEQILLVINIIFKELINIGYKKVTHCNNACLISPHIDNTLNNNLKISLQICLKKLVYLIHKY